jgi:hypothetical protein
LGNSFIIAICEIIKKPGYDKNNGTYGIVVVPDEDDIIIRYLFVLKNQGYPSSTLDSTKMGFDTHYSEMMKVLN